MYKREQKFNYIVLGFFFHSVGYLLRAITNSTYPMIILGLLAWYYILKGFFSYKLSLKSNLSGGYRSLLLFYLLLCVVMIIRGYLIDYPYQWISVQGMFNYHFLDKYYLLPYLMPLVCLIPWDSYKFNEYCKFSTWAAIATVVTIILFWNDIVASSVKTMMGEGYDWESTGLNYAFYAPFVFTSLLAVYMKRKKWLWNLAGLASIILIYMILARRGASLIYSILGVVSLYYWSKAKKKELGILPKIGMVVIILAASFFVMNSSLFDYLFSRGIEDTRSGVDEALLSQMTDLDMIFGKGLNGRYYYPLLEDDFLNGWRYGTETGFYNIVLKGGYVMAFTYILLLLIPAYKGIFQSHNILCNAGGFFILLSLFELYPFGWLEFSLKFLAIWMMVVLCMNPNVRNMSDLQIKQQFFS